MCRYRRRRPGRRQRGFGGDAGEGADHEDESEEEPADARGAELVPPDSRCRSLAARVPLGHTRIIGEQLVRIHLCPPSPALAVLVSLSVWAVP